MLPLWDSINKIFVKSGTHPWVMTKLFWAFYFFQTTRDYALIVLLICSLDHVHHHIFKANINAEFIYCCFQLLPQGINIMMTSALKTCFVIFFSKIKMDLLKIAKNLGLTLFFEFQFYVESVHTSAIQILVWGLYYQSPKFFSFSWDLLLSSFLFWLWESQKRLLPN